MEIYNRMDANSSIVDHDGKKFTKHDLILESRKLLFEGIAKFASGMEQDHHVNILILSDVVVFLQEINQKYHLVTHPKGKSEAIPVRSLLAKEKLGEDKRLYLISTSRASIQEPDKYELQVVHPYDHQD